MSSIGTFGAFTTARLGIYASQTGLSITGNNISNINTVGYTRQSLDQISFRMGGSDRYHSHYGLRIGNGVLCTGISQIRDPYLDIRYRNELASVGAADTKLNGLNNLATILDEVYDGDEQKNGVLEAQFMDFIDSLERLSQNAGQDAYDNQVMSSAKALVTLFNSYSDRLDKLYQDTVKKFHDDVNTVNGILSNIQHLNTSIRKSEIHGDSALELRDERNRLIDELSKYMKIDVTIGEETVGGGQTVEKLEIKLSSGATLVDGIYVTQLDAKDPMPNPNHNPKDPTSLPYLTPNGTPTDKDEEAAQVDKENFAITLEELTDARGNVLQGSTPVNLGDNDLYGALQATRELLTESGEFASQDYINNVDKNAATKRGIPYYQKTLDLLANKFAEVLNNANNGLQGGVKVGGNLFSNSGDNNDGTGITAGNISISADWANGKVQIVQSFQPNAGSTANDNILHMVTLMGSKLDFVPPTNPHDPNKPPLFTGTFQEMLGNISSTLGDDQRSTNVLLNTYYGSAVELDSSRMAVSGVDLNDEAANLMQYQQSYSAACRLLTTLDESLDKLINGTGVVGR